MAATPLPLGGEEAGATESSGQGSCKGRRRGEGVRQHGSRESSGKGSESRGCSGKTERCEGSGEEGCRETGCSKEGCRKESPASQEGREACAIEAGEESRTREIRGEESRATGRQEVRGQEEYAGEEGCSSED